MFGQIINIILRLYLKCMIFGGNSLTLSWVLFPTGPPVQKIILRLFPTLGIILKIRLLVTNAKLTLP